MLSSTSERPEARENPFLPDDYRRIIESARPEDAVWARCLDDFRTHGAEVLTHGAEVATEPLRTSVAIPIRPEDRDLVEVSKAVAEVLRRSYEPAAVLRFPSGRRLLARLSWDLAASAFRLSIDPLPFEPGRGR